MGYLDVCKIDYHLFQGIEYFQPFGHKFEKPTFMCTGHFTEIKKLGKDIGVQRVFVVGNKMRDDEDIEFIKSNLEDGEALGFVHYNQSVIDSDRANQSPYDVSEETRNEIRAIKNKDE